MFLVLFIYIRHIAFYMTACVQPRDVRDCSTEGYDQNHMGMG